MITDILSFDNSTRVARYVVPEGLKMPIVAYLWGAGGAGGGQDANDVGGYGSGGQGYKVTFNANPGDIIDISCGGPGQPGASSASSAPGGAGGTGYVDDTGNRYGGGRGGNAGSSGSSGGGGGGGGASTLTLISTGGGAVQKLANQTSGNLYDASNEDRLVAWVEGLDVSPALITAGERNTIKNGINYSSLNSYFTIGQIDAIKNALNLQMDSIFDSINSLINNKFGVAPIHVFNDNVIAYGSGVSFSYNGATYSRGSLRGTGTFAVAVSSAERLSFISDLQTELGTYYSNASLAVKAVIDLIIDTIVDDVVIDQFTSISSAISIYDYTTESPRTVSVIAVAGGGAGGGGAGNRGTTTGDSAGNTPTIVGTNTTGQNGTDKTEDGGGAGGGGGGRYGGSTLGVRSGDTGAYAGSPGGSWRDPAKTLSGQEYRAAGVTPAQIDRYSVGPTHAQGGARKTAGTSGYGILVINKYSLPFVKSNDEWFPVRHSYVKIGGDWKEVAAMYTKKNNRWHLLRQSEDVNLTLLSTGVNYGAGGTRS